jgi:hypothetical protein
MLGAVALLWAVAAGCQPTTSGGLRDGGARGDLGPGGADFGSSTSPEFDFAGLLDDAGVIDGDPQTCAEAMANKSYIGCDYWPTVTANAVWSIFDYAVVVSNPGQVAATVQVTGPSNTNQMVTVQPGALVRIYLPWVPSLKGNDCDAFGRAPPLTVSTLARDGAFHLVSSVPVLVYQFNALEYKGEGGPVGKDWTRCPGFLSGVGCFSFSNDASLLLPSTAMTGRYRVVTNRSVMGLPGYFSITATQPATMVKVKLPSGVGALAGAGVPALSAGATATYTLDDGDVLQLVASGSTADLTGSLVESDKPVQVLGGQSCFANPSDACDHLEESVMPAETLGKRYVVTMPTKPGGGAAPATVRFIGNVDGTTLTYDPAVPGAPTMLMAGQVVELGTVNRDFIVEGSQAFAVTTIQKSASVVDPARDRGDPALSAAVAVEQYRKSYVFLAPSDYDLNYADVVSPAAATLTLDGAAVTTQSQAIGNSGFVLRRIPLAAGASGGAHSLEADQPVGLQVIGYGSYTSYQYPAGLNLRSIAPPPPPIQ